jgi:hypothetical protein
MKEKVIEIIEMYRYSTTEGEFTKLTDKACNNLAEAIDSLYRGDIDKLKKEVEFKTNACDDLISVIMKLKEIINILSDFAKYGPFAFSEEEIMMRLEKVEQLKKGAGL